MNRAAVLAIKTGAQLAKAGCEAVQFKSVVRGLTRRRLAAAKRAVRKTRYAAEDMADVLVLVIRRRPMKAIGVVAGVAFGAGALAGWFGKRS